MLKNPQDRRAQRTAQNIKDTMLDFMEEKAIHEISVSEICKKCQINRATFYDHYRDVFDLVQDLQKDVLNALQELMVTVSPADLPSEDVSRMFFDFLEMHRRNLKLLLMGECSREFTMLLDGLLMPFFDQKIRQNYEVPQGMEKELRLAMEFVATGYYRFFMQALNDQPKYVMEEAQLCARLSDACLAMLFRKKEPDTH